MSNLNEKVESIEKKLDEISQTTKPQKEIITAEETMEILNISRNSFDRLRKKGILKVYRLQRKLYCKYSEVLQSLEAGLLEAA